MLGIAKLRAWAIAYRTEAHERVVYTDDLLAEIDRLEREHPVPSREACRMIAAYLERAARPHNGMQWKEPGEVAAYLRFLCEEM